MSCENVNDYITETDNVLICYVGDTFKRKITVSDSDGDAVNITGGTFYFYVKREDSDPDSSALLSETITSLSDPVNGIFYINQSYSSTNNLVEGVYNYIIKYKNTSDEIQTLNKGTFVVKSSTFMN